MAMLFDYECTAHGRFEAWGRIGQKVQCPKCRRKCSPWPGYKGITLDGAKPGFPRANRLWTERHERREEPGREV